MTTLIKKFPLDLTGRNPDNLVLGEPHELVETSRDGKRAFVPNYGGFYTQDMVVRDASGTELKKGADYIATYLYEDATEKSGLEVCGAVVVVNPKISSTVYLDYRVVGGSFAVSTNALEQVLQSLAEDDRPIKWGNIVGRPSVFPPGGHLHALWELYGFEYLVVQLERLTQAIIAGDQAILDEMREYIRTLHQEALDYTDALEERFLDHKNDTTNPHQVTKAQVGLGRVENYPTASEMEARSGSLNDRYMTPLRSAQLIDTHSSSGDHDNRYVRKNANEEGSQRINDGRLEAFVNGAWRVIWPAQWV